MNRITPATVAMARWRTSVLDTARLRVREEAVRAHHQRQHEDHERAEGHDLGARVARDVAEREAEEEPAGERSRRALQAAEHGRGEPEDEHRVEVRGGDEDRRG